MAFKNTYLNIVLVITISLTGLFGTSAADEPAQGRFGIKR